MILQLSNQKIKIQPMRIPEPKNYFQIHYVFEAGTNHLLPKLTVGNQVYEGANNFVDIRGVGLNDQLEFKVELLDVNRQVVKTYVGTVKQHDYVLFGTKPIRPDIEKYVKELEAEIVRLQELGEVI